MVRGGDGRWAKKNQDLDGKKTEENKIQHGEKALKMHLFGL